MVKDDKTEMKMASEGNVGIITFKAANLCKTDEIAAISREIDEFVKDNKPKSLIVDFAEVSFFSSQVLGMLLSIRSKLEQFKGELVISAINPQLHRVFKITNLDQVFRFFPDKTSALKELQSSRKED